MSWISKDYPQDRLLSDLKDIAISKIINLLDFFCIPLTSTSHANEFHRKTYGKKFSFASLLYTILSFVYVAKRINIDN